MSGIYADNYTYHQPGLEVKGVEEFRNFCNAIVNAFPDGKTSVDEIFGVGVRDRVAFRQIFEGTHKGEFSGIPPTGKKVKVRSIVINHFSDGKEMETWESYDRLDLMQQLGALPPTENGK